MQYRGVCNLSRAVPKTAVLVMGPRASRLLHSNTENHAYFTLDIKLVSVGSEEYLAEPYFIKSGSG